mgnify:CR=1 FL=1
MNQVTENTNRWRFLITGVLVSLVLGMIYAWSIFTLPLENEFGWTRAQTSLTFSISIITLSIGMIFGGRIIEKKGVKAVSVAGALMVAAGFFLASATRSLMMLYISYGVFVGLGVGAVYISHISTIARWFPDRKGFAMGILTMGFGMGGLILGGIAGYLIESMGWVTAFRALALISLVVCVTGGLLVRFPGPAWKPTRLETQKPGAAPAVATVLNLDWNEMIKTKEWWQWWFWDLFLCASGLMVIGHIVPLAMEKGVDKAEAIFAMGILSVSNGCGRLMFGTLWDRFGKRLAMTGSGLMMGIALFCVVLLTEAIGHYGLYVAVILTGLAYGGLVPINNTFILESFGPKHSGINIGLGSTPLIIAVLAGPYLGSYIKMNSGYDTTMMIGGAVALVSFLIAFSIGDVQKRLGGQGEMAPAAAGS